MHDRGRGTIYTVCNLTDMFLCKLLVSPSLTLILIIQYDVLFEVFRTWFLEKYFVPSMPWLSAKSRGKSHIHVHQEIFLYGFIVQFPNHSLTLDISEIAPANYCGL